MPREALLAACLLLLLGRGSPEKAGKDNGGICMLPVNEGLCKAKLPRWHYDQNTQTCKMFSYGGCQGNANNFRSKKECEQTCRMLKRVPPECRLKPDKGSCGALYRRYYFNTSTMMCKKFYYGGCKGNENRFHAQFSCMDHCLPEKSTFVIGMYSFIFGAIVKHELNIQRRGVEEQNQCHAVKL